MRSASVSLGIIAPKFHVMTTEYECSSSAIVLPKRQNGTRITPEMLAGLPPVISAHSQHFWHPFTAFVIAEEIVSLPLPDGGIWMHSSETTEILQEFLKKGLLPKRWMLFIIVAAWICKPSLARFAPYPFFIRIMHDKSLFG
jgi:hypothetical protein